MAWIESHQRLGRHPKLLRLASNLRIHKATAVGHLQYLWWWSLDFAPTGDLSAFTSAEISAGAEWPGEPDPFHNALRDTGWIDDDGKIHDWFEYAGKLIDATTKNKERQQRFRERNRYVTVTSPLHNALPNLTNITKQDITNQHDPTNDQVVSDVNLLLGEFPNLFPEINRGPGTYAKAQELLSEAGSIQDASECIKLAINAGASRNGLLAYACTVAINRRAKVETKRDKRTAREIELDEWAVNAMKKAESEAGNVKK